ncbi:MAG: carboxypeptidase regulatory-like domain-containing protein [Acidobacteriota bacterium]
MNRPIRVAQLLIGSLAFAVSMTWFSSGLRAQSTSGVILGSVWDPQGARIPNAHILLTNLETGQRRRVSTNEDGNYRINGLPVGRYEIRAEREGFTSEVRSGIPLTVAEEVLVDLRLAVKPIAQEVLVVDQAISVETGNATTSGLVDSKKIRDLPLNGRDMAQLILLQPGVVNSRSSVQSANTGRGTRFAVSGSRPNQNLFTLDGTTINDALNNTPGSAQGLLVGVETVREFRVLTSNFGAEYGRAVGGVFLAVTKSGTNDLHGSAFEFLRNDVLDTRNFFDREKPAFKRNQFGFSAGGPLRKNRTFWFGSYEALREQKGVTRVALVPDEDARRGKLPGGASASLDPRSVPILELFPKPNGRNLGDGSAEFVGVTRRTSNGDFFTVKLDHSFTEANALSVRYLFDDSTQVLPRNYPDFFNLATNRKQVVTVEERTVVSATVFNEARFSINRSTPSEQVPPNASPLQLIRGKDLGEINVTGLTEIGTDRTNPKSFFLNNFQGSNNLIIANRQHNLKLGGAFDRFQNNAYSETRARGLLRFRSLSDLLRFRVRDLEGATSDSDFARGYRQSLMGAFVQHDLRVNRHFTLNSGLRYEWVSTPTEVNGKVSNLRHILDSRVTLGPPYFEPRHHSFSPRVGFALDPTGSGKTSLRGGFGIYVDQPLFHVFRTPIFRSLPFVNRGRLTGISGLPVDGALFRGVDASTEAFQFDLQRTYAMHYSLNVQRELWSSVLSLSYAGSRGVNLLGQADANIAIPQILPDGREFFPEGSRRRNPSFDQVRSTYQGFNSVYNSLTGGVLKRINRDLQFQASYTFAKSIDDSSATSGRLEYSNGQARVFDPYNRRLNRARSDFDVRHTFSSNFTYQFPVASSLRGFAGLLLNGWQMNGIIMLSSGVPFTPLVAGDPDRDASDENAARPNRIQGVSLVPPGGRSPNLWFNPDAFGPPQPGFRGNSGRNIVTGPNFKTVDFSLVKQFRLGESRSLQFRTEVFNLFNRANFDLPANSEDGELIYNYLPPSGSQPARFVRAASMGKIFGTIGDSREIQFALKFIF